MNKKSDICRERTPGYAKWLAQGFDTIQECFGTMFPEGLSERLDDAQQQAREMHEDQAMTFDFGGEVFQIRSRGSEGNRWVLADNELQFHIRTDKPGWNINVRYLAAGLWLNGVDKMRARAMDLITSEGFTPFNPETKEAEDWVRLSRVDYALDLHSPEFSKEQMPGLIANNMLLTSGVKGALVFNSRRNETIQIGMRSKTLQIQIYDKGKETIDKPGKEWIYDIWEGSGYQTPLNEDGKRRARDVWRFEVRFGKEFLKDRNVRTFEKFHENWKRLIGEALDRRRMIVGTLKGEHVGLDYKHRERLDLHPVWAEADNFLTTAQPFVPRGRIITMKREAYVELLEKQQAGIGRSLCVAKNGGYDEEAAKEDAEQSVEIAVSDEDHDKKINKCLEKQMFIDDPD